MKTFTLTDAELRPTARRTSHASFNAGMSMTASHRPRVSLRVGFMTHLG